MELAELVPFLPLPLFAFFLKMGGENGKYLLELAGDDEILNDEVAL